MPGDHAIWIAGRADRRFAIATAGYAWCLFAHLRTCEQSGMTFSICVSACRMARLPGPQEEVRVACRSQAVQLEVAGPRTVYGPLSASGLRVAALPVFHEVTVRFSVI